MCCPFEGNADVAQQVERILGKDEVTGSNPVISSMKPTCECKSVFSFALHSNHKHTRTPGKAYCQPQADPEIAARHLRSVWDDSRMDQEKSREPLSEEKGHALYAGG